VKHLVDQLPRLGVAVRGVEDIEYAHEIRCVVADRTYVVTVAYDWVTKGWWEVSYWRQLSWIRRLLGASESDQTRALTLAREGKGSAEWKSMKTYSIAGRCLTAWCLKRGLL
jgi:hypothetical protein